MINIRVGGVPEHFNLPWRIIIDERQMHEHDIELSWEDYPGGSGAMADALARGELDAAVLLTEAAVAAVGRDLPLDIVSFYTTSPLVWGLHVPAASSLREESELRGRRYAISRHGSGSHLMSFAHARSRGWPADELEFVEVGSLEGAIEALAAGRAEVFFWEKFMTQPLVTAGIFRRVAEFSAPWPAFVSCVAKASMPSKTRPIRTVLEQVCEVASTFKSRPDALRLITDGYGLTEVDARAWLDLTCWANEVSVDQAVLDQVADILLELDLIAESPRAQPSFGV